MNVDTTTVIQEPLASGERLLWSGLPVQGVVFKPNDVVMIPFSLLWGGFAFFWEYEVMSSGKAPIVFMLWGIPFVLVGLHFIVGRFFVDAKQRANTAYGVTNQRIIIVSGIFSRKTKSLNMRTLTDVSLDEKTGGRGTITFGPSLVPGWWATGVAMPGMPTPAPMFELIEDARSVFEIIRKAQTSTA